MTVDLTFGLAKFEGDSGKAAQIITRDSERMSKAARSVAVALQKQADQAGRTTAEFLALRAAESGLPESFDKLIVSIGRAGDATARLSTESLGLFSSMTAAAEAAGARRISINAQEVASIRQVVAAAEQRRQEFIAQSNAGTINTDQLKANLAGLRASELAAVQQIKDLSAVQRADEVAAAARTAAAQRIIDAQNGITASYRTELEALRKLRDAGALTPEQFRTAGAALVAKQPAVQQREREAAEAQRAADQVAKQKKAEAQAEADALAKRSAAFQQLRQTVQQANYQIEQTEIASAAKREAAAQRLIDVQNGLTATYRQELAALRELRDAGSITPAQFKTASTELVSKQPGVKQRAEAEAAGEAAQRLAAADALRAAQAKNTEAVTSAASRVFLAFKIAEVAAVEQLAAAEARSADVQRAIAAASERSRAAQQAAYETKVTFVAKINEEAAALFRTRDAQRELDAVRAGVGAQQAQQLAKFAGDREFIASIYAEITAQEKLRDEFGKTTAEILRQDAAQRGLTNTTAGAIGRFEALAAANKKTQEAAAQVKSNEGYLAALNAETNALGKQRSEIIALELAQRGLTEQGAGAVARLREFEEANTRFGRSALASGRQIGLNINQLQTLKYTLSDVVASLGSGISPFTILLQQGGQVAQIEGGIGGIFRGIVQSITPFRLAVGGAAAAVGVLGYAWYEGAQQSKAFKDALVVTGNYAGQTEGLFNATAKAVAASGQVTIGAAREAAQALISTGQVGPRVFGAATEAAAKYGEATSKNAKEVATDFASMGQDVAKWAAEHNKSLNFISSAQYNQIKTLQEQGRAADAQGIVYDALNARFTKLDGNLGYLDRILKSTKGAWSSFWDAAFDIGRDETIEDKIARTAAALAAIRARGTAPTEGEQGPGAVLRGVQAQARPGDKDPADAARKANLEQIKAAELVLQSRKKLRQDDNAFADAERADATKQAIAFDGVLDALLIKAKYKSEYAIKLVELQAGFTAKANAGTPVSADRQKAALAQLKKDFTDQKVLGDADQLRKSILAKDLQVFAEQLAKESDALKFHQDELRAIYAQGNTSLAGFYDDREATIAAGVAAELAAQKKAQDRLRAELAAGKFKDPHERTDTEKQLAESIAKSANIQRDADHAAVLATYERAAAVKELAKQVGNFQANLLQLSGDEFGAAQIRAKQVITDAQEFAKRATSLQTPGDFARFDRAKDAGTDLFSQVEKQKALTAAATVYAEVQRRVAALQANTAGAAELLALQQERSGKSLIESEKELIALRQRELEQLIQLRDIALEAAQGSSDPAVLQRAADLALAVAKAADVVDASLNRMRAATSSLAGDIASIVGSVTVNIGDLKRKRYEDEAKDVDAQRAGYDKSIEQLQGFLAKSTDLQERARLKELIAKAQHDKDMLKVSNADAILKTLERDILGPIVKKVQETAVKIFVTDPLEKQFKGFLTKAFGTGQTDAAGNAAAIAQEASDKARAALATSYLTTQTTEAAGTLQGLALAAESAGAALLRISGDSGGDRGILNLLRGITVDTSGAGNPGGINGGSILPDILRGGAAGGTNELERDMITLVHKGEAITPKAYNPSRADAMRGGGNVYITNTAGAQVSAKRDNSGDWQVMIEAAADLAHNRVADDVGRGTGRVSTAFKSRGVSLSGNLPRRR